jgi:multisubunit Na+/H+ antiporter MnhB subunit
MRYRIVFLMAVLVVAGVLWGAMDAVHPFGEPSAPLMDDYFLESAQAERAANNVVTAIVFDYRGFDTLGEAAVLFTAVCSIAVLFRSKGEH